MGTAQRVSSMYHSLVLSEHHGPSQAAFVGGTPLDFQVDVCSSSGQQKHPDYLGLWHGLVQRIQT